MSVLLVIRGPIGCLFTFPLSRVADPDSIGSVDPDSDSGSGSRRAKMTHKSRKKIKNFMF